MSRILFLDIDGVLNPIPLRTFPRLDRTLPQRLARQSGNSDYLRISTTALQLAHESWDKESLALLRSLCEDYDLQIVISSSWGIFYSLKELRLLFALHDLAERILAVTPYVGKRSENILAYVQAHPTIEAWISLDDLPMDAQFPRHAVTTHGRFRREDAQKAARLLKQQL